MPIAKGTEKLVIFLLSLSAISIIASFLISFLLANYWQIVIFATVVICSIFLIWDFRSPRREIEVDRRKILAPADGIIVEREETEEGFFYVIRMSPFDVHMNRSPIKGEVKSIRFKKGSHWPVYFPNYAKRNQRNTITITNDEENIKAIVTQVSGIFARRTIAYVREGDKINQGEIIGTIRFGSITRLKITSSKKFKLVQECSSSVRAGLTVLAELNDSD
jgi:phosphatidylserine decarboxylase